MYVKPMPVPPGANLPLEADRIPLMKVFNGDTWTVDATLVNPVTRMPATPDDTVVKFVLAENRFAKALWTGAWHDGVEPSGVVSGLVHVKIPKEVSSSLRRGVYAFSIQIADDLGVRTETQARGNIQVEYEPTSDVHDIPYRTDESREGENVFVEE
jgi:hypothetical protein